MQHLTSMYDSEGQIYDLPSDKVDAFREKRGGERALDYRLPDGREYSIPESQATRFAEVHPDAQPMRSLTFANGSTRRFTSSELRDFMAREYRESDDYKADRDASAARAKEIAPDMDKPTEVAGDSAAEDMLWAARRGRDYVAGKFVGGLSHVFTGAMRLADSAAKAFGTKPFFDNKEIADSIDKALAPTKEEAEAVGAPVRAAGAVAGTAGSLLTWDRAFSGLGFWGGNALMTAEAGNDAYLSTFDAGIASGKTPEEADAIAKKSGVAATATTALYGLAIRSLGNLFSGKTTVGADSFKDVKVPNYDSLVKAVQRGELMKYIKNGLAASAGAGAAGGAGDYFQTVYGKEAMGDEANWTDPEAWWNAAKGFATAFGLTGALAGFGYKQFKNAVYDAVEAQARAAATTPETRAAWREMFPEGTRNVIAKRVLGKDISRSDIKNAGFPEMSLKERNAVGDAMLRDYMEAKKGKTPPKQLADGTQPPAADTGTQPIEPTEPPKLPTETTTKEKPNETGNVPDEKPAQPKPPVETRAEGAEAVRPVEGEPPRGEAPRPDVVKPAEKPTEPPQGSQEPPAPSKTGEDTPKPAEGVETPSRSRADVEAEMEESRKKLRTEEVLDDKSKFDEEMAKLTALHKERTAILKDELKNLSDEELFAAERKSDAGRDNDLPHIRDEIKSRGYKENKDGEWVKPKPKPVPDGKGKMVKPKVAESDYGVTMFEEPSVDGEGVSYVVKDGPSDAHRMMFKSKAEAEARLAALRAERKAIKESPSATLADGTKVHLLKTDEGWVPYNENYVDLRRGLFKAAKTKAEAIKVAEKGVKWAKDVAEFNSAFKRFEDDFGLDEFNKKVGWGNENGEGWNESAALEHLRQFDLEKLKDMKERAKRFNLGHHNGRNEKIQEWFDKVISEKKAPVPDGKGKMVKPAPTEPPKTTAPVVDETGKTAGVTPPDSVEAKISAMKRGSPEQLKAQKEYFETEIAKAEEAIKGKLDEPTKKKVGSKWVNEWKPKKDAGEVPPSVTIKIPGDGEFTVPNNPDGIARLKMVAAKFKAAPKKGKVETDSIPRGPSLKPAEKPKIESAEKEAALFVSDGKREPLRKSVSKPFSDGEYVYATDGRMMVRRPLRKGEKVNGEKDAPIDATHKVIKEATANRENDTKIKASVSELYPKLIQAGVIADLRPDYLKKGAIQLWRGSDGKLQIRTRDDAGNEYFTDGLSKSSKPLAQIQGEYLQNFLKLVAKSGGGEIEISVKDAESPLLLKGGGWDAVLMPLRTGDSPKSSPASKAKKPASESSRLESRALDENVPTKDEKSKFQKIEPITPEQEIEERLDLKRINPKRRSDPKVLAWAKRSGRTVTDGKVTPDAVRAYDEAMTEGVARLAKRWFPDMKIVAHKFGETIKRGQHVLDMRVGIRGAEKANDYPAMRNYNIAEKMLRDKSWDKMSIEEKRKFALATGYQVGADGMLKRQIPDFDVSGALADKLNALSAGMKRVEEAFDAIDNARQTKGLSKIFGSNVVRKMVVENPKLWDWVRNDYPALMDALLSEVKKVKGDIDFSARLVDVIDGDGVSILRRYYPDIDNIKFRIEKGPEDGTLGWFNPLKNEIVVTHLGAMRDANDIRGTLLHEVQHFVQHKEGFGEGGSYISKSFMDLHRRYGIKWSQPDFIIRQIDHLLESKNGNDPYSPFAKAMIATPYPEVNIESRESLIALKKKMERAKPYSEEIKASIERAWEKFGEDADENYRRLIGEVEARDTQRRANDPSAREKLFEETEDRPADKQIDVRTFQALLDVTSEMRLSDKHYLRDTSGRTLGWFDPNSKEVHLLPGADPRTVAHEIMWHGTRDYISQLAAKGDARAQRFLDMMHDVEKSIPEPLKKKIIAIYTKGTKAPTSDTLMNEFGAWFTMEKGGKALEDAMTTAEGRNWFAKALYAVKEVYKDFLAKHGGNRVDPSEVDGMTRDEFVDFLAKEFAGGKTLGEITGKTNALSTKETKLQAYRRKAYDNNAPVRDLERDIEKKTGKKISADDSVEAANALKYGLKEAANIEIQGKMADFRKTLGESGIHYEDLEYYAALKAAAGRDAKIDKRNIDKLTEDMKKAGASAQDIADAIADYKSTNGSHIDPREAKKMLAEIENGPDAAKYKAAYDKLRAIIDETLDTQVAAGLVDAKDAAQWRAEEPNYVPFKNEYDPESGDWEGRGTSRNFVRPEHRMAKGRQSAAGDIIAHVFMDHQAAKHRAIENDVRKKLAELVRANPEIGKVELLRKESVKNIEKDDPNVVVFKDGGRSYAIRLNGTRGAAIANAFTQRNLVKMEWADKGFEVFGKKISFRNFAHWSSGMATRYSPTFAIRNTTKDNIELANIVYSERGPIEGTKFMASYAANRAKMAPTLAKYVATGKIDTSTTEGQILDRYIKAGGLIAGGVRAEGMDSIKARLSPKAIAKEMKRGKSRLVAAGKHVVNSIAYLNEYAEMATRVGVFATEVKAGKSDAEAALFSRRATVDFNRHGDYTPAFNVFRLFSNSTLGATARAAAALGKSKYGKYAALAMFANGLAQALIEYFYNQDEDERREKTGEATGKDMSEFDRKTSLFYFRDGDKVYKVAQHESPFSLLTYAGNSVGRWLCGEIDGADVARNLGVSTAELAYNFLPMGQINLQSRKGGFVNDLHAALVSGICPSVLQPVAELAWNVDFKGDTVLRETMNAYDPKSHNGKEHTPDWAKQSAEWLNDSTGGNAGRRGFVDIAPEAIQKLVEGYGKNALRDVSAAYSVGKAIADGDISGLDPRNTPVKRDFVRPLDGNDRRFNDALSQYKADKNEVSKMKDAWTDEELSAYEDAHPWVADAEVKNAMSEIQKLRKMEQGFSYKTGKATPYEWSKEETEEFKKERRELQAFVLEKMRK